MLLLKVSCLSFLLTLAVFSYIIYIMISGFPLLGSRLAVDEAASSSFCKLLVLEIFQDLK
jgi:hypothetical protein